MKQTQSIQNYPTRLHEDWRYFFLKPDEFETLLAHTTPVPAPRIHTPSGIRLLTGGDAAGYLASGAAFPDTPGDVFTGQTDSAQLELLLVESDIDRAQTVHMETTGTGTSSFRNLALVVNPGVTAEVLFRLDTPAGRSFLNGRLRIIVSAGASLKVGFLGSGNADSFTVARIQALVAAGATLNLYSLQTGNGHTRMELSTTLTGPESAITIDQAVLAGHRSIHDTVVKVIHSAPDTRSDMNTLTYAAGNSQSILNGLIRVEPEASNVHAYQQARNYILSDDAYCVGYPQLEIQNPEVACSHGTTMHTFDENHLYYLGTRGISPDRARSLILKGHLDYFFRKMTEASRERFTHHGYAKIDTFIS